MTSSPDEEKHQTELTIHEIQTNVDDLRHDLNRFETEISSSDDKIHYLGKSLSTLKEKEMKTILRTIQELASQMDADRKTILRLEEREALVKAALDHLTSHAESTICAFKQYKERLGELEQEIAQQNEKFEEMVKMRNYVENVAAKIRSPEDVFTYTVKAGDTLEAIAKSHQTSVEEIKTINHITKDLVVGQKIQLPK
ncbi:MAG: LysM peptidoglycan-binding domain-containing protein [Chlamydiota bacterium]